jgi:diguanylate cyclase (GGDEF)-like protein
VAELGLDLFGEQATLLDSIARGASFESVLDEVAVVVEERVGGHCSIAALAEDGKLVHHSQHLPRTVVIALNRSRFTEPPPPQPEPVVVLDPLGRAGGPGRPEPLAELGVQAGWAQPLIGAEPGVVLGSLLVLHPDRRAPTGPERRVLQRAGQLAVIALQRHVLEHRLHHRALHDDLTGLPNRHLLLNRIRTALDRRRPGTVAVLFVSVDRFKAVLGRLGDAAGDLLLQQVGGRLRRAVRPGDTVARFGGDEFVVLCEGIAGEGEALALAGRLTEGLAAPIGVEEAEVVVTASVGIARTTGGDRAETLIRNAELAMHRAKERGGARYVLYDVDLREQAVERAELEGALRQAVADDELQLAFQPKVCLADGTVTGVEALVRWTRRGHGMVPPDLFVPVAEQTGLITAVGRWVLEHAVAHVARLPASPLGRHLGVTVNLAAQQLAEPDLVESVAAVLAAHDLEPSRLCLEVTETDLVHDPDASAEVLGRLKELGVRLAIDDFGTGYATLDYARRFSMADVLKIDGTFVAGLGDPGSKDRGIVAAAIVLARALGYETVAEGVESDDQLAVLLELGCDEAQGFLFSPPVTGEELVRLVRDHPTLPS